MNTSGEVADLMVKEGIQITESATKLAALGAKNLAAIIIALVNDDKKLQGKTNLKQLLKSDKPLCILQIKEKDLSKFNGEAKKYGVLFTAVTDKTNKTEYCDIIAKQDDVTKLNYILEKMEYPAPVAEVEPEKEADKSDNTSAPDKDGKAKENTEKNRLSRASENRSENSLTQHGSIGSMDNPINAKPSVKQKVEEIKEQRVKAKAEKEPDRAPQYRQPTLKKKKNKSKGTNKQR